MSSCSCPVPLPAEPSRQKVASSAAKGSLPDLRRLVKLMNNLPQPQRFLILPVLYVNLDEAGIPSPAELDDEAWPSSVQLADLALAGLHFVLTSPAFPTDTLIHFWPRVWAWMEFLHIHNDCIPNFDMAKAATYLKFSTILNCFHDHGPMERLVEKQVGLQALCTRAWMLSLGVVEDQRDAIFSQTSCMLLLDASIPKNFQEILDEAGGSLYDLAALVVKHLELANPRLPAHSMFFGGALTFLDQTNDHGGPFAVALLENGVVAALVKAVCDLDGATGILGIPSTRLACMELIQRSLSTSPGYTWMEDALRAGLLRVLAMCGGLGASEVRAAAVARELLILLMRSMVYYPVVLRMKQCFHDVERLASSPAFLRSPISADWKKLKKLVGTRLEILEQFETGKHPSLKACDNLEVGIPICS